MKKANLALVLSSGGARGMAHIGVIKVLEKNGIVPGVIVGTSAGALVGGIYASGQLEEFEKALLGKSTKEIKKILQFWPSKKGLIKTQKLEKELRKIINNKKIEELDKKFIAVAVDLLTGNKVLINKGDLYEAIIASSSIPLLFPPVEKENMLLVDGGLLDPIAIDIGFKFAKKVIAVHITRKKKTIEKEKYDVFKIVERALSIMQSEIVKTALKKHKKNLIVLKLEIEAGTLSFEKTKEIIAIGELEATKHIEEIKKFVFD